MVSTPGLPFPGYKWRWASLTPSEGLNESDVYLGVLRVLGAHEGDSPGDASVLKDLQAVKAATGTRIDLARGSERNLIRNSGQYWISLGLLEPGHGTIELTDMGRRLASGGITPTEFAPAVVRQLRLPNNLVETNIGPWTKAGLQIRPLRLILEVMGGLRASGVGEHYLTREELTSIVIPLAGQSRPVGEHVTAVSLRRQGTLSLAGWPDCVPSANDARMAGEFLKFLSEYGFCVEEGTGRETKRYFTMLSDADLSVLLAGLDPTLSIAVTSVQKAGLADLIDRKRVSVEVLARPGQTAFRRDVLAAYGERCLLTGASFPNVLEAAHIRPVKDRGSDKISNGLCLRKDVHYLYDAGHIRIRPSGDIEVSEALAKNGSYSLPATVSWPPFVSKDNVDFRWGHV